MGVEGGGKETGYHISLDIENTYQIDAEGVSWFKARGAGRNRVEDVWEFVFLVIWKLFAFPMMYVGVGG